MYCRYESESRFSKAVYVEELAWEEGWVVKVLVIVSSVSGRTRDPRIKINSPAAYIYVLIARSP